MYIVIFVLFFLVSFVFKLSTIQIKPAQNRLSKSTVLHPTQKP
ncbi:hypothetical protein BH09BAC1_BH09BAC1_23190 [soil metagenome]